MRYQQQNRKILTRTFLVMTLSLSACAEWQSPPKHLDENFGNSVRHVINAQTLYPENAYNDKPIMTLDGQKSGKIIRTYRNDVTLPEQSRQRLKLDIEGGK